MTCDDDITETIRDMIELEIKSKRLGYGDRKGKTVYFAMPKTQVRMTYKELVDRIVRETSLTAGDVSNAIISIANVVCDVIEQGGSVDLADLGSLRATVSSRMMDSPGEVTVRDALLTPKIAYKPKKSMRESLKKIEVRIVRDEAAAKPSPAP